MRIPELPVVPTAEHVDVDAQRKIADLFWQQGKSDLRQAHWSENIARVRPREQCHRALGAVTLRRADGPTSMVWTRGVIAKKAG